MIENSGNYSIPLVLGKSLPSLFTAILIDFATALKMASILWCSLSPSAFILRLHLAASEKDFQK